MERTSAAFAIEKTASAVAEARDLNGLTLDVVSCRRVFLRLEHEWNALFEECKGTATLFQSHAWVRAYVDEIAPETKLAILTARDNGRLVAVAPLMLDRHLGVSALRWIGGTLAIYGDVLARPGVDVADWLTQALRCADLRALSAVLENVRAGACVAPFVREQGREVARQSAQLLDMTRFSDFSAWQGTLSTNTRRGRKRRQKNLEAQGRVSFEYEAGGPTARGRIADLFALKRAWAKSRGVISRTIDDKAFAALVTGIATTAAPDACRISTLLLDDAPIAIELGFVTGPRYLSYLGAYDPAYHAFSPGSLQLERTLDACFADGIETFDLLPPNDDYKAQWANSVEGVATYAVPLTTLGILHSEAARLDVVGLAKAGFKKLPQPARHALHRVAAKRAEMRSAVRSTFAGFRSLTSPEWSLVALAFAAFAMVAD